MNRDAIIWRESIYKDSFKCNKCGTKLAADNGEPVNEILFMPMGNYFVCPKCYELVAQLQIVDVSEDVEGLQGDYNEYKRKQKREKRRLRRR